MTNRWAVLIGGDFYIPGNARSTDKQVNVLPALSGCVRDVQETFEVLCRLGVSKDKITRLTASTSDGDRPIESPDCWPTYENIKRTLEYIAQNAERGDLVYFHYSGHGIQRNDLKYIRGEREAITGMALATTDVLLEGKPFLSGYHLGIWIREMVEQNGLKFTIILDCCYSGHGFRNVDDYISRDITSHIGRLRLSCDDQADLEADLRNPDFIATTNTRNLTRERSPWLQKPQNCSIITACRDNESAGERDSGDGFTRGVLTHNLLRQLRLLTGSPWPSHAHVIQRLRQLISDSSHYRYTAQHPVLYGDGNAEFFGTVDYFEKEVASILCTQGDLVWINVGKCQGASVGSIYDLLPPSGFEHIYKADSTLQARVQSVESFSCTAQLSSKDHKVNTTWRVSLRQWAFEPKFYIGMLNCEVSCEEFVNDLQMRLEMFEGLEGVPVSDASASTVSAPIRLYVRFVDGESFQILNQERKPLSRLPLIRAYEDSASSKLAYALGHLARYHRLLDLCALPSFQEFPSDHFELDFNPNILKDGEFLKVTCTYSGESAWVSIFCFNASWGIEKIEPQGTEPATCVSLSGRPLDFKLKVFIPQNHDVDTDSNGDIEDTWVLFASKGCDQPISWGEICLPSLPLNSNDILTRQYTHQLGERGGRNATRQQDISEISPPWTAIERIVKVTPASH